MTWLAWRQFRTSAATAVVMLAAAGVLIAVTGIRLSHLYDSSGIASCQAAGADCGTLRDQFLSNYSRLRPFLELSVLAVPAIVGMFFGAPLIAHELETGSFRLAWTQSVTRTRWLAVKLAVVGLAGVAVAGLLSLAVTLWFSNVDDLNANRFSPGIFDARGVVAMGYAVFAFALGVTAGVLFRRTLPAMVTTIVAFVLTRLAILEWVRPHFMAPLHRATALDPATTGISRSFDSGSVSLVPRSADMPNAWTISTSIVDNAGHALTSQVIKDQCPTLAAPPLLPGGDGKLQAPAGVREALHDCITKIGANYHEVVTYQPASRYWAFQWMELAIFAGLGLVLAGICFWWIRRRLA